MLARNLALRIASLAFSVVVVLYIRYYYGNPYTVSTNIMLSTLLFSVLKAGFSFDHLSNNQADARALSVMTPDKVILIGLAYAYSRYLGVEVADYIYALFSASVVAAMFISQYTRFTEGRLISAVVIAFVFPAQALINIALDYYAPGIVAGLVGLIVVLVVSFDKFIFGMQRMARAELYYTVLLPAGGLSAISLEGIDKSLYLLVSKVVDSGGSVASFLVQGNLKVANLWARRRATCALFVIASIVVFILGCLVLSQLPTGQYLVVAAVLLVNIVWLIYSLAMLAVLVADGEMAVGMLIYQAGFCLTAVAGLYFAGLLQPHYIVVAMSLSLVLSMVIASKNRRSQTI